MWSRDVGKRRSMTRTAVMSISFNERFPFLSSQAGVWRSGGSPSTVDGNESSVDELSLAGAEVADERGNVLRRAEAADGLAGDEFGANLFFFVGVVLVEVAFDEGRLDGARSDAVDAQLLGIVDGDLAGHGENG